MRAYILIVLLVTAAGIAGIYRIKLEEFLHRPEVIAQIKLFCVWADENIRGTKKGQERLAYVCGKLCQLIPKPLQPFITAEKLAKIVNMIFDEIKVKMQDGTTVAVR